MLTKFRFSGFQHLIIGQIYSRSHYLLLCIMRISKELECENCLCYYRNRTTRMWQNRHELTTYTTIPCCRQEHPCWKHMKATSNCRSRIATDEASHEIHTNNSNATHIQNQQGSSIEASSAASTAKISTRMQVFRLPFGTMFLLVYFHKYRLDWVSGVTLSSNSIVGRF